METETNDKLLSLRPDTGDSSLLVRIETFIDKVSDIVTQSETLVPSANDFTVDSEVSFQFADELRLTLEQNAKNLDAQRLQLTRPIDDLKSYVVAQVKPAIDNNNAAATVYLQKALAYRRQEKEKAEQARREAEAEQRRKQDELNAAAAKREAAANQLKTQAAKDRALAEAEALRQAAIQTPTVMAVSAPGPQSNTSSIGDKWHWEINNWAAFCGWLKDHPEWLNERGSNNCLVAPKVAAMNKFANHYADSIEIPGVRIWPEEHLRKKPQRG